MVTEEEAFWCVVTMIISGGLGIIYNWVLHCINYREYWDGDEPSILQLIPTSILFTVFFCAAVGWVLFIIMN